MKKVILVITAAMLCPVILNAQNDKSFRLGLLVCPNMGWITTDAPEVENDGSHLGFRFGLLSDFKLGSSTNYFFSTGLFMNSMGAKLKTTLTDSLKTVVNSEVKLQYVELPITIKLKTNEIGYLTYFGQIGVNAGKPNVHAFFAILRFF